MIASGEEDSPLTPLFRALASYVHYQAGLTGTRTPAGRLDPPLLMALDEVAVICPVDLPAMLADAADKGILIMPVVHGTSQLEDRWGKPGGATIWATCDTKLLLPGISNADTQVHPPERRPEAGHSDTRSANPASAQALRGPGRRPRRGRGRLGRLGPVLVPAERAPDRHPRRLGRVEGATG
jgi:hypothetical protein